ncbi:MAG: Holliday junction branch migration protein RuvA [Syntrophobacteraceae bacterium]|jgi:Holliday junction DNA helicase RuvA|nr:Holliday junction branch migration protein RuvA [Syntrophobacteraceae bacterium]
MIGHLCGKLHHKSPEQIILDVNGVGYCVQVPLSTFYELPGPGGQVSLHIHTHVREDALQLYGFRTADEREIFLALVTVNGVGPRLAVSILSGISPDELRRVLMSQDHRRLQAVPGVGRKIAERIVLELRDRWKERGDKAEETAPAGQGGDAHADALSALMNLGYRASEAGKALGAAQKLLGEDAPLERLLKEALRTMAASKGGPA